MIAEPKLKEQLVLKGDEYEWGEPVIREIPAGLDFGLYIECEIVHPPSSKGRNITLRIAPDKADAMLRALRDYGIARRNQTRLLLETDKR